MKTINVQSTSLCCHASVIGLRDCSEIENEIKSINICSACETEAPAHTLFKATETEINQLFIQLHAHKTVHQNEAQTTIYGSKINDSRRCKNPITKTVISKIWSSSNTDKSGN